MTRTDVMQCLLLITGAYPNLAITEVTVDAWSALLEDLPADTARQATVNILRQQTGSWWPTPGSIRQEVMRLLHGDWPSVDQAWGQVTQAIRRYGYMHPHEAIASLDPPVAQVARALGWQDICEAEPGIIRGQFAKFYMDARSTAAKNPEQSALPVESPDTLDNARVVELTQWASKFGKGVSE